MTSKPNKKRQQANPAPKSRSPQEARRIAHLRTLCVWLVCGFPLVVKHEGVQ